VTWLHGDVTTAVLEEGTYDVWHDRAVFHFLTDAADRRAYVRTLTRALKAQGHVVIAAFSPDGPTRCSGLDVRQYDAAGLHRELGDGFVLSASEEWLHTAPNGARQAFVVCRFSRSSSPAG
jgi:hypothetical protein